MTILLWLLYVIPLLSFAIRSATKGDGVGFMLVGALGWPVIALWGFGAWMRDEMMR